MTVTFDMYDRIMRSRPFKLDPEEVDYREGDEYQCQGCMHFYARKIDGWAVCELVRDEKDDDNEDPIKPDWVCQFWTADGDSFPLLEPSKDPES